MFATLVSASSKLATVASGTAVPRFASNPALIKNVAAAQLLSRFFSTTSPAFAQGQRRPPVQQQPEEEEEEEEEEEVEEEEEGQPEQNILPSRNPTRTRSLYANPIVEFRTYTVQPAHYPAFLKLTNEHIHKRLEYSQLLGYFTTEIGGVNEVCHFWIYDSLYQRQKVREALVKDEEWMGGYMKQMRPMLQKQENVLLAPIPDVGAINEEFSTGSEESVFVLRTFDPQPFIGNRKDEVKESEFMRHISTSANLQGNLMGAYSTYTGATPQRQGYILWNFPSLEHVDAVLQEERQQLDRPQITKILFPTPFSPWQ